MSDLTPREVADELRLHVETVLLYLRSGELTGYRAGRRFWRVTRESLDAFKAQGAKTEDAPKRPVGRPRKAEGETP